MVTTDGTVTTAWQHAGITCAIVPGSPGYDVQLRNPQGTAFLRKTAPTIEAARNEAEYLRLLLEADSMPAPPAELKPFALVIEDDGDSCEALAEALKSVGIRALGVAQGMEAVRLARALAPDLIVVDHRLPDITGAEVCRRLRDDPATEPVPIIAVTGAPDALRAEGCVADAVLTKPCRLDTFIAAARLFLRQPHLSVRS
ncbi:MAG TPA: response regulator [Vicinamibacterales bacterium]|nr:response regulator [Vicinamibacterales bacterium]